MLTQVEQGTRKGEIVFREVRDGDEPKIVDLFWNIGPHGGKVQYWNWLNKQNPFGESIVEVGVCRDALIGHYAVMPVDMVLDGTVIRAGLGVQAGIHRQFRNVQNILAITDRVWQRCEKAGIQFIYGFPNDKSWPVNLSLMAWKPLCDFRSWECSLKEFGEALGGSAGDLRVHRINAFSDQFDAIWENSPIAKSGKLTLARTSSFLNWRFIQHPLQSYVIFAADLHGEPVGYLVVKFYRKENILYGHLVDVLTVQHDIANILRGLLRAAIDFFEWMDVDVVSYWMCPDNPYDALLRDLGFSQNGFNTHFGYKAIAGDLPEEARRLDRWHLTMADSDAF